MTISAPLTDLLHRLNDATKPVDAADRNLITRALSAAPPSIVDSVLTDVDRESLIKWVGVCPVTLDGSDEVGRLRAILQAGAISTSDTGSVPIVWQVRRSDGRIDGVQITWENCTQKLYEATLGTGRYAGDENGPRCEVRALAVTTHPSASVE